MPTESPTRPTEGDELESDIKFAQVPESILYHPDLSPYDVVVWSAIQRHAGPGGAFPSYRRLADLLGISRRTAVTAVSRLIDAGVLVRRHRAKESGDQTSNRYVLLSGGGAADSPPSANAAPPLVQMLHQGGANAAPEREPLNESPLNERSTDVLFEDFWTSYPRGKAGKPGGDGAKKPARQKWRRLTDEQRDLCLVAVGHYRAHVESPDGPHAAHALTWLNQERWDQWQTPAQPRAGPDGVSDFTGQQGMSLTDWRKANAS